LPTPPDVAVPQSRSPGPDPSRTVTAGQVANAIMQLRERPGQCASAQVEAVRRALDLTVVPDH